MTFADHADLVAVINAGGDIDLFADGFAFQSASPAVCTGLFNYFTTTAAGGAGDNLDHLSQEGLLHLPNLTRALTGLAGNGSGTRFSA